MHIHGLEEKVLEPEAAELAISLPDPVKELRVTLYAAHIDLGELPLELSCVHAQLEKPLSGLAKAHPSRVETLASISRWRRVRSLPWSLPGVTLLVGSRWWCGSRCRT